MNLETLENKACLNYSFNSLRWYRHCYKCRPASSFSGCLCGFNLGHVITQTIHREGNKGVGWKEGRIASFQWRYKLKAFDFISTLFDSKAEKNVDGRQFLSPKSETLQSAFQNYSCNILQPKAYFHELSMRYENIITCRKFYHQKSRIKPLLIGKHPEVWETCYKKEWSLGKDKAV